MDYSILLLFLVAIIWGFTNSLMKKGAEGIEKCSGETKIKSFFSEIKFLLTNWKYLLAYGVNQCGSLIYYFALGKCELSLAGPITNSLTFIFTYISGSYFFGEKEENSFYKKLGLFFVCSGITLCIYDKL